MKAFDEETFVDLGKEPVEALFRRQETPGPMLDDRGFIPLFGAVVNAFGTMGLSAAGVEAIWNHSYNSYDRLYRRADLSFGLEENRELIRRYLVGHRRSTAVETKKRSRYSTWPGRGSRHD